MQYCEYARAFGRCYAVATASRRYVWKQILKDSNLGEGRLCKRTNKQLSFSFRGGITESVQLPSQPACTGITVMRKWWAIESHTSNSDNCIIFLLEAVPKLLLAPLWHRHILLVMMSFSGASSTSRNCNLWNKRMWVLAAAVAVRL